MLLFKPQCHTHNETAAAATTTTTTTTTNGSIDQFGLRPLLSVS
jgi:hypothetical protein